MPAWHGHYLSKPYKEACVLVYLKKKMLSLGIISVHIRLPIYTDIHIYRPRLFPILFRTFETKEYRTAIVGCKL